MNNIDLLNPLVKKVSLLIGSAQGYVAKAVNKGMVLLYWNIGKTIQVEIIKLSGLSMANELCRHCLHN